MTPTKTGAGYWLGAADGGVFGFGDAAFKGSAGAQKVPAPVVAMAATPTAGGYWLTGADGATYVYGDAPFKGPATGAGDLSAATRRIVAASATPTGQGYWQFTAAGTVLAFGDAGDIPGAAASALPLVGAVVTPAKPSRPPRSPRRAPWRHCPRLLPRRRVPPPPPDPVGPGALCNGKLATSLTLDASGAAGPAVLTGTKGDDVIVGSTGKDIIDGGGGDDIICGGPGDDIIKGGDGDDVIKGGHGQRQPRWRRRRRHRAGRVSASTR